NAKYCSQAMGANAYQDVLCSGEFLTGFLATLGVVFPSAATKMVLYYLGKKGLRVAFLQTVLGLFSNALMISLAQAASTLWTQATKYLGDAKLAERAHGLAGRFVLSRHNAETRADWAKSPDAELFKQMTEIMYDIVVSNPKLRGQWLNNL